MLNKKCTILVNDESKRTWKEVMMGNLRYYPRRN